MSEISYYIFGALYFGWSAYRQNGWSKWVPFCFCCCAVLLALLELVEMIAVKK